MKILIVGSGGREHAIAASVAKSPKAEKIYCAPGNAGIAQLAECVPIGAMEFDRLTEFAKEKEIDLVIVGMDDPLVGGLVDQLEAAGIRAFGPRKNAAILEGSKAFSKELMKKYQSLGPTLVVATFGEDGSLVWDGKEFYSAGITPAEKVVNTVGAGDSFLAGFMHGIMTGKSIPECQKEGADLSAKIVAMFDPY